MEEKEFIRYLKRIKNIGKTITGKPIGVIFEHDNSSIIARTDGSTCYININNYLSSSFFSKEDYLLSLSGLAYHEFAHIIMPNFKEREIWTKKLKEGYWEADMPMPDTMKKALEDQNTVRKEAVRHVLIKIGYYLENIIDDIFIETKMAKLYPGLCKKSIKMNRTRFNNLLEKELYQKKDTEFEVNMVLNLILFYCSSGKRIKREELKLYYKKLEPILSEIPKILITEDIAFRWSFVNKILAVIWPYIKDMLDNMQHQNKNVRNIELFHFELSDNQELSEEIIETGMLLGTLSESMDIHVSYPEIEKTMVSAYEAEKKEMEGSIKDLSKKILNIKKGRGGKQKGQYTGRQLNVKAIYRPDQRIFINNNSPKHKKMAIALLIDQSWSMEMKERIKFAKKAAIFLYEVCSNCRIPVAIYGHNTRNDKTVQINSFIDFQHKMEDKYKITAIERVEGANRDGMAIRYAGERLSNRPEKIRLLILISDGRPCPYNCTEREVIEDLKSAKKELQAKGILLFSAAVGEDKEIIKEIYESGYLDISDIHTLPASLINLMMNYI